MTEGGTVVYVSEKGYFFIRPDMGTSDTRDIFGHLNHVVSGRELLRKGARVMFELAETRQGKLAANQITVVDEKGTKLWLQD
jgi:cold shock CspA family protein